MSRVLHRIRRRLTTAGPSAVSSPLMEHVKYQAFSRFTPSFQQVIQLRTKYERVVYIMERRGSKRFAKSKLFTNGGLLTDQCCRDGMRKNDFAGILCEYCQGV